MTNPDVLQKIDRSVLMDAFPDDMSAVARAAAGKVARRLMPRQHTERFSVRVGGQTVLIPARLHFACYALSPWTSGATARAVRALQTRSNNGYERQRAVRDVLSRLEPWGAPFVAALIGDYVIEILDEIDAAVTAETEQLLATFITDNPAFWGTIKRRVTSYWDVYYRHGHGCPDERIYSRADYVGFKLTDQLDKAVAWQRAQRQSRSGT